MKRSVVLLSSGLDSAVNLFKAKLETQVVLALTFDYGQRAAPRESERAAQLCAHLGLRHQLIDLPWFNLFTETALINRAQEVPTGQVEIDDLNRSKETAKAVWVPNRNGVFLNIAAAFAEGLGSDWIVPGFNREEAMTFPDNSNEFMQRSTSALAYSTANRVEVHCFTTDMDKTEIFALALELKVPIDLIWPCYFAGAEPCGECESCRRFQRARRAVGA